MNYTVDWLYSPFALYSCSDRGILEGGERNGVSLCKLDSLGEIEWAHNYTLNIDCDFCGESLSSSLKSTGNTFGF